MEELTRVAATMLLSAIANNGTDSTAIQTMAQYFSYNKTQLQPLNPGPASVIESDFANLIAPGNYFYDVMSQFFIPSIPNLESGASRPEVILDTSMWAGFAIDSLLIDGQNAALFRFLNLFFSAQPNP